MSVIEGFKQTNRNAHLIFIKFAFTIVNFKLKIQRTIANWIIKITTTTIIIIVTTIITTVIINLVTFDSSFKEFDTNFLGAIGVHLTTVAWINSPT